MSDPAPRPPGRRWRRRLLLAAVVLALPCLAIAVVLWLRPGMEIVPPPRRGGPPLPEPAPSLVSVRLWLARRDLEELINRDLQAALTQEKEDGSVDLEWQVEPIKLTPIDGGLRAATSVSGRLSKHGAIPVHLDGGARLALSVAPQWTPEWRLMPHATATCKVTRARLTVLGIPISFQTKAEKALRPVVMQAEKSCNRLVASLPARGLMQLVWLLAQSPQQVRRQPPVAWLQLRPQAVQLGPVQLTDERLEMQCGLRCAPVLGIGCLPESLPRSKLPPPEPPGPPGFALTVPVRLDYAQIAADLRARLAIKTYALAGKRGTLRITDLRLYPSDQHLVAALHVDLHLPGRLLDTSGWIYLWGRPACGGAGVRFDDLDYHEATRSHLAHLVDGTLHDELAVELRGQLDRALGKAVAQARTRAVAAIARHELAKGLVLTGRLEQLEVAAVALQEDALVLAVVGRGEAAIQVELDPPPVEAAPAR